MPWSAGVHTGIAARRAAKLPSATPRGARPGHSVVDRPLLSVALFTALLGALLVALLAPAPIAAQEWQPATPGYPWEFPDDHWAHVGYQTEWWYFVGFAESPDGSERFAWQFTLFRTGLTLAAPPAAPSPGVPGT